MGEMADYYLNQYMNDWRYDEFEERDESEEQDESEEFRTWPNFGPAISKRGLYWVTQRGEYMHITEMKTSHMFNAFKMLFNHMVSSHQPNDLHRVGFTVFHFGIEQWCRKQADNVIPYLCAFANLLMQRGDMSDSHKTMFQEIMSQLCRDHPIKVVNGRLLLEKGGNKDAENHKS
jgi:hypothetical protein